MHNLTLQAMLMSQTLTMTATAYAISKTSQENEQEKKLPAEKKGEGFKGLIKKLNPVRLFSKLFKKKKENQASENEAELDL